MQYKPVPEYASIDEQKILILKQFPNLIVRLYYSSDIVEKEFNLLEELKYNGIALKDFQFN
jgi:hypothetical protein